MVAATLGTGGVTGVLDWDMVIDRVTRLLSSTAGSSTLGTGCTLGGGWVCLASGSLFGTMSRIRSMSRRSLAESKCLMFLIAPAQSAKAAMILSYGVIEGFVMFLCWNCTVSLNRSLRVLLM